SISHRTAETEQEQSYQHDPPTIHFHRASPAADAERYIARNTCVARIQHRRRKQLSNSHLSKNQRMTMLA
ncbi:MAG TPA: hypothetical protein VN742_05915, partial [Candidatus Binataceae bacterium]|nr:hypothetical protein [Candidatus Binataceae bacterium]